MTKPPRKSSNHEESKFTLDAAERGQGVGAEDDRNDCQLPRAALRKKEPGKNVSSTLLSSPNSRDRTGYLSLDDVPTDVSRLSVEQVLQCLRWLNLHTYVEKFRTEQVDGELLMSVDQQMLIEELRLKRFDAMKLQTFARQGWRPKFGCDSPSPHHQQLRQQQFHLHTLDNCSESYA